MAAPTTRRTNLVATDLAEGGAAAVADAVRIAERVLAGAGVSVLAAAPRSVG
jgi:hypothetical protein